MNDQHKHWAYLVIRLALGVNFFLHGLVRFPKLNQFAENIGKGFQETMIPTEIAVSYGYVIPFIEALVGIALILGIFTSRVLLIGGLFMSTLIVGKAMQQDWGTLGTQMVYVLTFYFLLRDAHLNKWELVKD